MKRIFLILLICLTACATPAFAQKVLTSIPSFKVKFNGTEIENSYRQFPLIVYKDITYVPMTYFDCRYMGLSTDWNSDTNTLVIEKSQITCAWRDYRWEWENTNSNKATVCDFNIIVNGKEIDNSKEEYPLITFRDVTYFPLTWRFAADEFGWEYFFDNENGLAITSDNPHAERVLLKGDSFSTANNWQGGNVATDGIYYYYQGKDGERDIIYRSLISGEALPEVIYELPKPYNITVGFFEDNGMLYFKYFAGGSAVTGNTYVYRILSDAAVKEEYPGNYFYQTHGSSWFSAENNGISVKGTYAYIQAPVEITYKTDGIEKQAELSNEKISIDRWRNGKDLYVSQTECIKIFGDKIYFTAVRADGKEKNSNLYVIDTKTGKLAKLLDGVCGFYVYNGWVDELKCDSTMIIYDNNGILMRYTEINGDIRKIESEGEEGLILYAAVGSQTIYTVQKTLSGDRTVIKAFDCYANGSGSRKGEVFETTTGTFYKEFKDKLCVYTNGESENDEVRLFVAGKGGHYKFSDAVTSVFIHEDTLLYTTNEAAVKVNLK